MYSSSIPDLSLYIHIPFCKSKCIYCDFLSFADRESHFDSYFEALKAEIRQQSKLYGGVLVKSIFVGGGTPSYAGAERISDVLKTVYECFNIAENAEITVEMNPGTVSAEDFEIYKKSGVNRLSFGVQSLDDDLLCFLGRIHTREEFIACFENARKTGFKSLNCDLIFGIPGQTEEQFKQTLEEIISLAPGHISAYSLIVEPDTKLCDMIDEKVIGEPSDELDRKMYHMCRETLTANGYSMYELSNFAKEGSECCHNIRYWTGKNYLGFGLGAASLILGRRFTNTYDFDLYVRQNGTCELSEDIILSPKEQSDEFMMLGFRMTSGPSEKEYEKNFGKSYMNEYRDVLDKLQRDGLIAINSVGNYCLTVKGLDYANEVFREFV